jgi:hypothetical protein
MGRGTSSGDLKVTPRQTDRSKTAEAVTDHRLDTVDTGSSSSGDVDESLGYESPVDYYGWYEPEAHDYDPAWRL